MRILLSAVAWLFSAHLGEDVQLNLQSVIVPVGVIIAVMLYRFLVIHIGVQVVARGATDWIAVSILWLAFAYLSFKIVDLIGEVLRLVLREEKYQTS